MVQARQVQSLLRASHPELQTEIVKIKTSAEWSPDQGEKRLSTIDGGKGLFTKEIESALLDGRIDIAVHSMKDVESFMPDGLVIGAALEREDARDALLVRNGLRISSLADLPQGAIIGTASVRRAAMILARRPDVKITPFRGNVETRIQKIRVGQVDASFLAMAGLNRLGLDHEVNLTLEPHEMLPAAGQGIVGIQCRARDENALLALAPLNNQNAYLCLMAERACLAALDGSCHTPIGAYALYNDETGMMDMRGCLAALDGSSFFEDRTEGKIQSVAQAEALGQKIAQNLKAAAPEALLQQVAHG